MLALTMLLLVACYQKPESEPVEPDAVPPYVEEEAMTETPAKTLPPVQVKMPEYELAYAGELADLVVVAEEQGTSNLVFFVKLSSGEAHIFTLRFNVVDGELVMFVTNKAGERIPVSFEMAEVPEGLNETDADAFYTAQEAVNEIAASLVLK